MVPSDWEAQHVHGTNSPTTVSDWKAAFKDFATPIVNIQNAPATPVPGAGLAGLSELLGKSGVFKDITGLEGNQQNVIRTDLSNQENAKAFGEIVFPGDEFEAVKFRRACEQVLDFPAPAGVSLTDQIWK